MTIGKLVLKDLLMVINMTQQTSCKVRKEPWGEWSVTMEGLNEANESIRYTMHFFETKSEALEGCKILRRQAKKETEELNDEKRISRENAKIGIYSKEGKRIDEYDTSLDSLGYQFDQDIRSDIKKGYSAEQIANERGVSVKYVNRLLTGD